MIAQEWLRVYERLQGSSSPSKETQSLEGELSHTFDVPCPQWKLRIWIFLCHVRIDEMMSTCEYYLTWLYYLVYGTLRNHFRLVRPPTILDGSCRCFSG